MAHNAQSWPGLQSRLPETMTQASKGRIRTLDGLRGLAALVVLIHHSLLASAPKLAALYSSPSRAEIPRMGSLNWLVFYTPLHIFWAGPEFVAVFFVLSGLVLALPVIGKRKLRLASYYPSRLLRLYLPASVAVGFAVLMHIVVSHKAIPGASAWLNTHATSLSWQGLFHSLVLGPQAGNWAFNTALWTMYWIVLFALLLPLLLIVPFAWRIVRLGVVLLCFWFLWRGTSAFSLEIPPFVLGVVLAFELKGLQDLAKRWRKRSWLNLPLKSLLAISCICLLTIDRWLAYTRATLTLVVLGACLGVIAAVVLVSWRKSFESKPMQWLGQRAFSLYLVHEPLVVALAFLVGATLPPWLFVIVAASASMGTCSILFRYIESPSHRFARAAGIRCTALSSNPDDRDLVPA